MFKKIILVLCVLCLNIIPNTSVRINTYAAENKKELSGKLTITTYQDLHIRSAIERFKELHPKVDITLNYHFNGNASAGGIDRYNTQLAAGIMSGKGDDIIDLTNVPYHKYIKSGLFCDLYQFMDKDPSFNREDYYTNIFKASEYKGKLYLMPTRFTYSTISMGMETAKKANVDISSYESLNYQQILNIYDKVLKSTQPPQKDNLLLWPGVLNSFFDMYELGMYYDVEKETDTFNSEKFIDFLKTGKSIKSLIKPDSEELIAIPINNVGLSFQDNDLLDSDYVFISPFDVVRSNTIGLLMTREFRNISSPVPIARSDGKYPFFYGRGVYAINQGCKNKELAWEFLKFYIGEKDIDSDGRANIYTSIGIMEMPINKSNFKNYLKLYVDNFERLKGFPKELWDEYIGTGEKYEKKLNDTINIIDKWNRSMNVVDVRIPELDPSGYIYYDTATAEETANAYHKKASIYLSE